MFERMYLSPQNKITGDLRTTFGNPTGIGLGGFLVRRSHGRAPKTRLILPIDRLLPDHLFTARMARLRARSRCGHDRHVLLQRRSFGDHYDDL